MHGFFLFTFDEQIFSKKSMLNKKFLTIILTIFMVSLTFSQRNYKFENFGNRSILLNGNVTGSVDDLGATYYNPARLALIEDPVFLINAKMFQLTNVKLDNVTLDGNNLSSSNFDGVPSMIAGTFKIKSLEGHQFAYTFFSRNRSDLSVGYNSKIEENDYFNSNYEISKYINDTRINNQLRENWYGGSWAKSIASNFSIGASLFFSTYKFENGYSEGLNAISESNAVSSYNNLVYFEQKSYGFFGKIAAAWVLPKVEIGINVDLPYIEVFGDGEFKYEEYLSGFSDENDIFTFNHFEDVNTKRKYPLGISTGVGIPIKKHQIHANLSYNVGVNPYTKIEIPRLESETETDLPTINFVEELKPTVNFGVGGEFFVSEKLNAYGSFSTDFSPFVQIDSMEYPNASKDLNYETDYYHVGFGVNVSHKWANFILGTVYSRGNTDKIKLNSIPLNVTDPDEQYSRLNVNRWRFILGLEVLFLDNSKLEKLGLDNKLF
ncbi:MAG: hypothetical protein BM563_02510 [Bacteroidetes bacterium MedPE-SWsnd-G1]|nr:MAG: hypothetical protein BM563_02510 [Bacteroidetes bacterium MedPE-SWsnd-G1]